MGEEVGYHVDPVSPRAAWLEVRQVPEKPDLYQSACGCTCGVVVLWVISMLLAPALVALWARFVGH